MKCNYRLFQNKSNNFYRTDNKYLKSIYIFQGMNPHIDLLLISFHRTLNNNHLYHQYNTNKYYLDISDNQCPKYNNHFVYHRKANKFHFYKNNDYRCNFCILWHHHRFSMGKHKVHKPLSYRMSRIYCYLHSYWCISLDSSTNYSYHSILYILSRCIFYSFFLWYRYSQSNKWNSLHRFVIPFE